MKLAKYPQSCFLIEAKDKRVLIDPGILDYASEWLTNDWAKINLILITHKHQDHCNISALKCLVEKGAMIFSSKEVQDAYPELRIHIIKEGDVLNIPGGLKIEATRAIHGYIPALKGKEIKENIGFIVDDGDIKVYFTSDTIGRIAKNTTYVSLTTASYSKALREHKVIERSVLYEQGFALGKTLIAAAVIVLAAFVPPFTAAFTAAAAVSLLYFLFLVR